MRIGLPDWPKGEGHFHDATEVVHNLTRRYAELTGQIQNWPLFAPEDFAASDPTGEHRAAEACLREQLAKR